MKMIRVGSCGGPAERRADVTGYRRNSDGMAWHVAPEITILIPPTTTASSRRFTLITSLALSSSQFTPPTHLNLLLLVWSSTLVPATAGACSIP